MAEKLLHGPDVVAILEQVRGEAMAKSVTASRLLDARGVDG
jgi:hypothetical protein